METDTHPNLPENFDLKLADPNGNSGKVFQQRNLCMMASTANFLMISWPGNAFGGCSIKVDIRGSNFKRMH